MSMTLKEKAWQSGLFVSDETAAWDENDWPPLEGGWPNRHATVVFDHLDTDKDNNDKRQTVVVMGGYQTGRRELNSVLLLNLADPNRQWREGPPMNKSRQAHAAVLCNGSVYVMGGYSRGTLDCIEQIDVNDLLQSSSTTRRTFETGWTTLTCRLSTRRSGCCAVALLYRYIIVMGGWNMRYLSSVDIIDTSNHAVIKGPSMTVPRQFFASAIIGHRIFVVGGKNGDDELDSVEYLDFTEKRKDDTLSTVVSFSSTWITHSELVLSNIRSYCAVVAVGSCLVVAGGWSNSTVEVLDTNRNRVWNLPPFTNYRNFCSLMIVSNQIAVISGSGSPTCATLPLMDKYTWCFCRLFKHQPSGLYHSMEGMGIRDAGTTLTSARKRARSNTRRGDYGKDEA